jgi:GNAT superfamily N-acetyltransferase
MMQGNTPPQVAREAREELLVSGGSIHERGDAREKELKALATELGELDKDIAAARRASQLVQAGISRYKRSESPAPEMRGESVVLRDSTEILIRPIEQDDAMPLEAGLEHLSAMSRYRRFRAPVERFTARELEWLTHVDHRDHEALVAIDPSAAVIVGVARYVCRPDDRAEANVTSVVADAWQERGVGTALIERLARRASAAGVERWRALMLVGDERAERLLAHVADEVARHRDSGTVEIIVQLRRTVPNAR